MRLGLLTCTLVCCVLWSALAQPSKGSLTINPQVVVSELSYQSNADYSRQFTVLATSAHYYITNRLAIGLWAQASHYRFKPQPGYGFDSRSFGLAISPELHYTLLATRLSPYVRVRLGRVNYYTQTIANPALPVRFQKLGSWWIEDPYEATDASVGLLYSLKKRLALNGQVNALFRPNEGFSSRFTASVGCQFALF